MKYTDWEEFKHSILIQQLRLGFSDYYSEKMGNKRHQRLVFWNEKDFDMAYWEILAFLIEQRGYCISTSIKNMTITVEVTEG